MRIPTMSRSRGALLGVIAAAAVAGTATVAQLPAMNASFDNPGGPSATVAPVPPSGAPVRSDRPVPTGSWTPPARSGRPTPSGSPTGTPTFTGRPSPTGTPTFTGRPSPSPTTN